jgi:hypothetical protein
MTDLSDVRMMHVSGPLGLRLSVCGACWRAMAPVEQLVPFARFRPDPETRLARCEHVRIERGVHHTTSTLVRSPE